MGKFCGLCTKVSGSIGLYTTSSVVFTSKHSAVCEGDEASSSYYVFHIPHNGRIYAAKSK
jgi:hypothetical protein